MTTGHTDYVIGNAEVDAMPYTDAFRRWTPRKCAFVDGGVMALTA